MNPAQPGNTSGPGPEHEPVGETHSRDTIYVFVEAVGDTTIRPMRSPVLRQIRPDQPPPPPPEKK